MINPESRLQTLFLATTFLISCLGSTSWAQLPTGWKAHDLKRPAPRIVAPADRLGDPPSDAIVLFNGKDLSGWTDRNGKPSKWKVNDGSLESVQGAGPIFSEAKFGDCQLHVEFATPKNVRGNGQGRGNSGVFLMEQFEIQVLDSFENPTYPDGSAGSLYGQHPPLVNASRGPGQWQSYDIIFHRPRFDPQGKLTSPANFTVLHNGVLIQDHVHAFGPTSWIQHKEYQPGQPEQRLSFQDHGNPVHYRNIWVRKLEPIAPPNTLDARGVFELTEKDKQALVGSYGQLPVTLSEGKLFIRFAGSNLEMVAHSKTDFSLRKSAGSVSFTLDDDGQAIECLLKLDAAGSRTGKRKPNSRSPESPSNAP